MNPPVRPQQSSDSTRHSNEGTCNAIGNDILGTSWWEEDLDVQVRSGNGEGSGPDHEPSEEADEPTGKSAPCRPSQEEVDEHNLTHIPFRSWCDHCIRGKAMSEPHHYHGKTREITKPLIAMDYMNMKSNRELQP